MYQTILFITLFLLGIPLFFKLLLDSNIEKFFKQGRISSIRLFMILVSIILSFLLAWAFEHFLEQLLKFFTR